MESISVKTVLEVYDRDKNTCQYCGKVGIRINRYNRLAVVENPNNLDIEGTDYNGSGIIKFEIHHLVPRVAGGSNDSDNLKLACRTCNRQRGYLAYLRTLIKSGVRL